MSTLSLLNILYDGVIEKNIQKYKRACVYVKGADKANDINEKTEVLIRNMLPPRIRAELSEIDFNFRAIT